MADEQNTNELSAFFREWFGDEWKDIVVETVIKEATINRIKKSISEVLSTRFEYVLPKIRENLNLIKNEDILEFLFRKAITIDSVESFERLVNKNIEMSK